jgi:hypothetical protein
VVGRWRRSQKRYHRAHAASKVATAARVQFAVKSCSIIVIPNSTRDIKLFLQTRYFYSRTSLLHFASIKPARSIRTICCCTLFALFVTMIIGRFGHIA